MIPVLHGVFGAGGGAAGGFESIATATGTGSSGTITFSSIPSTYVALQIRFIGRSTTANTSVSMRINSDTAANYARHVLSGDGTTVTATGAANLSSISMGDLVAGSNSASNIMGVGVIDIHDYASTSNFKTVRTFGGRDTNGGTEGQFLMLHSGLWRSTSAITSITLNLALSTDYWTTSSVFALYGIKAAA